MSRMKQDAEEVFAYILDRFEREEVVVLGNFLGISIILFYNFLPNFITIS